MCFCLLSIVVPSWSSTGIFICLRSHQDIILHLYHRSSVILPSVYEPLDDRNNQHNPKCHNTVIHAAASNRQYWWKEKEDGSNDDIDDTDDVTNPS